MNGVTIVTVNHLVKIVFQISFTIWSNFPKRFQIDGDFKHGIYNPIRQRALMATMLKMTDKVLQFLLKM